MIEFLRICFGTLVEGYGMTESACVIAKTSVDDFTVGHVGPPAPSCEARNPFRTPPEALGPAHAYQS